MKKKLKDRHLDTPSEANRDKHINFVALESDETDPADAPATGKLSNENGNKNKKQTEQKNEEKSG